MSLSTSDLVLTEDIEVVNKYEHVSSYWSLLSKSCTSGSCSACLSPGLVLAGWLVLIPHFRAGISKQGDALSTPGAVTSKKFFSYQTEDFCPWAPKYLQGLLVLPYCLVLWTCKADRLLWKTHFFFRKLVWDQWQCNLQKRAAETHYGLELTWSHLRILSQIFDTWSTGPEHARPGGC